MVLVVYANSFGLDLATDAYAIVHNDQRVRQFSAENLQLLFTHDYWWPAPADTLYRPITLLSYLVEYTILGNGERASGYHLASVLLHGLNVCLLFSLAGRLLRNRWAAFCAAALWAIHPIGTEAVANVSGRADLLAALAVLAGLLLHATSGSWTGRRRWFALFGIFALTWFGGLSKENALVLPGLLLLWDTLDWEQLQAGWRRRVAAYLASSAAIGVVLLMRHQVLAARAWPRPPYLENPLVNADFWTARLTAIKVLGMELWLLLFPARLSSDRGYNQIPLSGLNDPAVWISLAVMVAAIAVALARYRGDRILYFGAGFIGITLLPTANLLVLLGSVMAERFLYLPAVGFALVLAALLFRLRQPRTAQIAMAAILLLYAGRTFTRNFDWADNLTLETADAVNSPRSYRMHDLLARGLFVRNSSANIDRSIEEGETAWRLLGSLPSEQVPEGTLYHLGLYYGTKGELSGGATTAVGRDWFAKGIAMLERAREVTVAGEANFDRLQAAHGRPAPGRTAYQPIYKTLGLLYSRMARHDEALATLRAGRAINPETAEYYMLLAHEYLALGKPQSAAVMVLENAEIEGMTQNVLNGLREAAQSIPEASCVFAQASPARVINYSCTWLLSGTCDALEDLAKGFDEARLPGRASQIRTKAARQFGCRTARGL